MKPRTILLVEDDVDSRYVYGVILRHGGFDVIEATDGGECLRIVQTRRPDLIVMDLGLPRVDGWTATAALKQDSQAATIPVVAITVHTHASHRARAQRVGCVGFLEKPCTPQQLLHEVVRHL